MNLRSCVPQQIDVPICDTCLWDALKIWLLILRNRTCENPARSQNHLRFELEHTRSKMQEAQGLAAQRALATKRAKKQASEARDLAMRQQQQNRRALDAFDRAQGTWVFEREARAF